MFTLWDIEINKHLVHPGRELQALSPLPSGKAIAQVQEVDAWTVHAQ